MNIAFILVISTVKLGTQNIKIRGQYMFKDIKLSQLFAVLWL